MSVSGLTRFVQAMQNLSRRKNGIQVSLCMFLLFLSYFYKFAGEAKDVPRMRTSCNIEARAALRKGLRLVLRGGDEGPVQPIPSTGESKDSVSMNLRVAIKELKEHKTDITEIAATLRLPSAHQNIPFAYVCMPAMYCFDSMVAQMNVKHALQRGWCHSQHQCTSRGPACRAG